MTTDVRMNAPESVSSNINIGGRLKQKRLELEFDERHVATELKIAIDQVQALEANNFNYFRSVTFARGFLKSYCRLLDIDYVEVLGAFESQRADAESTIKPVDKIHKQTHLGDPIVIFISVVIVAILVFLVFWWPTNSTNTSSDDLNDDISESAEAPQAQEVSAPVAIASTEEEQLSIIEEEPLLTVDSDSTSTAVESNNSVESNSTDSNVVTGLSAETVAILKEAGVSPDEVVKATKKVEVQEPIAPQEADYLDDIVISFTSDCWTEIRDTSGTILFSGVKSAGSTLTLTGNAPYRVVLGYAKGVSSLKYKGEAFDFSSFTNKELARFELK
ncbi:RodZ domain-containing protein [Marinomonas colpomeniae]|nr:RodZ domain-containing protein [Marinomonas colpomeniae]